MIKFEQHITVSNTNKTIIELLQQYCAGYSLSNNQLKSAITKGALWLTRKHSTQRLRKIKKTLNEEDILHFYYDENVLNQMPNNALLIADLTQYSVWYKPYGMLCQGSKWSDHCTIARWAETHIEPQRPAFVVHRLDRAASGLIIIAHSKKMAQTFSRLFENRELDKTYQIIVHGSLANKDDALNGQTVLEDIDGKSAKSIFIPVEFNQAANISLYTVNIETGRKHQIRKHAASMGLPVVGDRLHGKKDIILPNDINLQLCAKQLSFTCPVEKTTKHFVLPDDLTPNLNQLAEKLCLIAN